MYDFLLEQLESVQDIDVIETPNYYAMIVLRDRLMELNNLNTSTDPYPRFTKGVANGVAARTRLDLTKLENLEQVKRLVTLFADIVYKLMIAMFDAGFSVDDINAMVARDMKLEIT